MAKRTKRAKAKERTQLEICQDCKGACCKYITIFIPQPTDKEDFDNIRWYLCHEGVSVFQDDEKDWAVVIPTRCKMLTKRHICKIYDERPEACRDYDARECENTDEDGGYLQFFEDVDELDEYLDHRWQRNRPARRKRR